LCDNPFISLAGIRGVIRFSKDGAGSSLVKQFRQFGVWVTAPHDQTRPADPQVSVEFLQPVQQECQAAVAVVWRLQKRLVQYEHWNDLRRTFYGSGQARVI
jgi:hypothetical protein